MIKPEERELVFFWDTDAFVKYAEDFQLNPIEGDQVPVVWGMLARLAAHLELNPTDNYAIEKAARFVSMIPYIEDLRLF